ncbi:hypothetical protein BGW36DRAFT_33796 [Talaromyces proteolyticus]|uniref:Large ribosomal subunit protein bL32m n=1 Tax=Talaromyces proteolyticus TaxID=1131652 RepID=A0AAD4PVA0_9EURO|nr:uncharacterized protein BGW36DRAFT_33796 [Talaromyces proteolyticus]KAH8693089.1 hypothetical protein BGW36DRAFT_33796 [Talaromyces proteolyticus]
MALRIIPNFSPLSSLALPILSTVLRLNTTNRPYITPSELPVLGGPPKASLSSLLADIWESVLRAVPKKKTSHMKKRHRQMAGKALKDVKSIVRCPGCGQEKRAHILCSHCVQDIKEQWKKALRE